VLGLGSLNISISFAACNVNHGLDQFGQPGPEHLRLIAGERKFMVRDVPDC
jgi:hypothetical protein